MTAHFQHGNPTNCVAFILSTPGESEEKANGPAAGETGDNIDDILKHLNFGAPHHFPSLDRSFYLITNASTKVMYAAKDNKRTEDKDEAIIDSCNIERVLDEVENCSTVILCGDKAELLAPYLDTKRVARAHHLGNKGLRNAYKNSHSLLKDIKAGADRDKRRKQLCAQKILEQLSDA